MLILTSPPRVWRELHFSHCSRSVLASSPSYVWFLLPLLPPLLCQLLFTLQDPTWVSLPGKTSGLARILWTQQKWTQSGPHEWGRGGPQRADVITRGKDTGYLGTPPKYMPPSLIHPSGPGAPMGMFTSPGTDHSTSLVAGCLPTSPPSELLMRTRPGSAGPSGSAQCPAHSCPKIVMWQEFEEQLETQKHNEPRDL